MKLPAASSGVSKYQPHKTNLAASCGELTPKEIRLLFRKCLITFYDSNLLIANSTLFLIEIEHKWSSITYY